jgi:hypothetical protein
MSALEIRPETAQMLAAQAKAQGLSVDEYLKTLLGITESAKEPALDEFMSAMESLAEEDVEPLPRDFSREDIYFPAG